MLFLFRITNLMNKKRRSIKYSRKGIGKVLAKYNSVVRGTADLLMKGLNKGSIGILGLAVLITLAGANGISNVVSQWSTVKKCS